MYTIQYKYKDMYKYSHLAFTGYDKHMLQIYPSWSQTKPVSTGRAWAALTFLMGKMLNHHNQVKLLQFVFACVYMHVLQLLP